MKLLLLKFITIILLYTNISAISPSSCSDGTFYFELTDSCENCSDGCSSCTWFHEKDCLDCKVDFYKIELDNQFFCYKCPQGQYYDEIIGECYDCDISCQTCLSLEVCIVCNIGYVPDSNYQKCDPVLCSIGYYRNPDSNLCQACDDVYALDCYIIKYYTEDGNYDYYDYFSTSCINNIQLQDNSCYCSYGFYLDTSSKSCVPCSQLNCTSCNQTVCYQCKEGYYLYNSVCVLQCDSITTYFSQSLFYASCYNYADQKYTSYYTGIYKQKQYCNNYYGYTQGIGCNVSGCKPFEFKLFDPDINTYICVTHCPINYTINLSKQVCIPNNCSQDLTEEINNMCFFRSCPLGQSFQSYMSKSSQSKCISNESNCLNMSEESSSCSQCKPSYIISGRSCYLSCYSSAYPQYYYINSNTCYTCYSSLSSIEAMNNCANSSRKFTYNVAGYPNPQYATKCPEGYRQQEDSCELCPQGEIFCDSSKTQYVCEWGQNNTVRTCDQYNLDTLIDKGFDEQGFIIDLAQSECLIRNDNNTCKICGSNYNFNFYGVCSKAFQRPTKYYVYFNLDENQYQVVDSCSSTQYVQRLYIGGGNMRVCKDFATCLQIITDPNTNAIVCNKCSSPLYNLNNNCIDNCPSYTYKNQLARKCEFPISNCERYNNSNSPDYIQCNNCRQGYIRQSNYTECILISQCNQRGTFFNVTDQSCMNCPLNCDSCDSSNKCLVPKSGFVLYYYQPVLQCPEGYYLDGYSCQKCSQFCKKCIDAKSCTEEDPQYYYRIIGDSAYFYLAPICKINEYYDSNTNKCLPCDSSCAQCYKKSFQCLVCSNSQYYLLNYECLPQCPTRYYGTTVQTQNYTRLVCMQCDESCLDQECVNTSTNCTKGCSLGYSLYQNLCLSQCPTLYISRDQKCYLKCNLGQYNPDLYSCASCKDECLECLDANSCTKCKSPNHLFQGICVSTCESTFFLNDATNECLYCGSDSCSTCIFTNITGTCTSCQANYMLDAQNKCVKCTSSQYYDSSQKKCFDCDQTCASCIDSNTKCTSCTNSSFYLINNQCAQTCPKGYYYTQDISIPKLCYPCNSSCLKSNCVDNATTCVEGCSTGYSSYQSNCLLDCPAGYVSINQKCYLSCQQKEYNSDQYTCSACKSECLECQDGNSCTKCEAPLYLQEGTCVSQCKTSFFLNPTSNECLYCGTQDCNACTFNNNIGTCQECKPNKNLDQNNICVQCKTNEYFNKLQKQCLLCDTICSQCFESSTQCLVCSDQKQSVFNGQCVEKCPIGYYSVQEITSEFTRQVCKQCDISCLNQNCQAESTTCVEGCSLGYSSYHQTCLALCPVGYISLNQKCSLVCKQSEYSVDQYTCAACKSECLECQNANSCTKCPLSQYLQEGTCVNQCKISYFLNPESNECLYCGTQDCTSCSFNNNVGTCQACKPNFILNQNNICQKCLINQYSDANQDQCLPCDASCSQCVERSTKCVVCANSNQSIFVGQCVDNCPSGYYSQKEVTPDYQRSVCMQCDSSCLNSICSSEATFCLEGCSQGYYSYKNKCLISCPDNYESRNFICYKKCKQGYFNVDQETCTACKSECLECTEFSSCTKCKRPLIYINGVCTESCKPPYLENIEINECINCGSKGCTQCSFQNNTGTCTSCKQGYLLNENKKCIQQEDDQKPKSKQDLDDEKYLNKPITYTGEIFQGSMCHFSCKQCKGSGPSDCLSCNLSTRVFFKDSYCICADGYQEDGVQSQCFQQSQTLSFVISLMDSIANWLILILVSIDRIPILTLQIIDILQVGSYKIYLEEIYNYAGKLPIAQVLYQSNFSKMIPNFIATFFTKNFGVYQDKNIVESDGDGNRELPLIFNQISISYILNSSPYFILLSLSLILLIILKCKNEDRFQTYLNKAMIIFYYLTFQDQILFTVLQLRNMQISSSTLHIFSIVGVSIAVIFNIFMIYRIFLLEQGSNKLPYQSQEQYKRIFNSKSIFIGLFVKSVNAASILALSQQYRVYAFAAVLIIFTSTKTIISLRNIQQSSKIISIAKIIIVLQTLSFALPVLLNEPNISKSFEDNIILHQVQIYICLGLIFQKIVIFSLEAILLLFKQSYYNFTSGQSSYQLENRLQQTQINSLQFDLTNIDIELILASKKQNLSWK